MTDIQCNLSDDELVEKVDKLISDLCKKGDKAWQMCVPPQATDSDVMLCELLDRFKKLKLLEQSLIESLSQ